MNVEAGSIYINEVCAYTKLTLSDVDSLRLSINKVFFDFTQYLHRMIVCVTSQSEDENVVSKRLNKVPSAFESTVSTYCNTKDSSGMSASISAQTGSLIAIIKATNDEDKRLIKSVRKDFISNSNIFCSYFSELSSDWPVESASSLYEKFIDSVINSVQSRMIHNWNADVIAFDNCVSIMNKIADMITNILIKSLLSVK